MSWDTRMNRVSRTPANYLLDRRGSSSSGCAGASRRLGARCEGVTRDRLTPPALPGPYESSPNRSVVPYGIEGASARNNGSEIRAGQGVRCLPSC